MIYDYMHVLAQTLSLNYPRYLQYIPTPVALFLFTSTLQGVP